MNKNKHMVLIDKSTIDLELTKGSSFKEIGRILGKDCTSISKEIRSHLSHEKSETLGKAFNDCRHCFLHDCSFRSVCKKCTSISNRLCWSCGRSNESCISYVRYFCPTLKKPPYVCNACNERPKMYSSKSFYHASRSQKE